jgi:hypothetical protein
MCLFFIDNYFKVCDKISLGNFQIGIDPRVLGERRPPHYEKELASASSFLMISDDFQVSARTTILSPEKNITSCDFLGFTLTS